jgi:hypothetical protein
VGKGKLHLFFVGVADRDHSVARPHRASHPLPFLDDLPVGLEDALADAGARFATPVREFCDQLVNTFRWIHWSFLTPGEVACDPFFLFFYGNDRAFAEPHATEKTVFQHELMVERGRHMGRNQNGQERCKNRMGLERGEHGERGGQRFAIGLEHAANEPSGGPSGGDHQKHDHIQAAVRNRG